MGGTEDEQDVAAGVSERDSSGCRRCGHHRHEPPSLGERLRRRFGRRAARVTCSEPTELGGCPCRSRFHTR